LTSTFVGGGPEGGVTAGLVDSGPLAVPGEATAGLLAVGVVEPGVVALVLLASGSFDQLLRFATFAIVAFSALTVAAVVVLRLRRPEAHRAFPVPGGVLLPLLFVGVNVWVLWSVLAGGASEARIGLAIVASGVPAYAAFRALKRPKETAG